MAWGEFADVTLVLEGHTCLCRGVEGARAALRHHFTVEQPSEPNPVDGKEVGLTMAGVMRRFQTPVKKKAPLGKADFLCLLKADTEAGQFHKVTPDWHGHVT